MKKILALLITLFSLNSFSQAPTIEWANHYVGTEFTQIYSIKEDINNNLLIAGAFIGTVDFDPGNGVVNLTSQSSQTGQGESSIFIQKLNQQGELIWVKQINNSDYIDESGDGIALTSDNNGSIYISSLFNDTVDFDPGIGVYNISAVTDTTNDGIFICKLSTDGDFIWVKTSIGITSGGVIQNLNCDNQNNITLTGGAFFGIIDLDFGPGLNLYQNTNIGGSNFLIKIDNNGNNLYSKILPFNTALGTTSDNLDNLFCAGYINDTLNISLTNVNSIIAPLNSNAGIFIKYNDNYQLQWYKVLNSYNNSNCYIKNIITSLDGSVFVLGGFEGTVDFDPSSLFYNLSSQTDAAVFIGKYSSNGSLIWVKQIEVGQLNQLELFDFNLKPIQNDRVILNFTIQQYDNSFIDVDPGAGVVNYNSTSDEVFSILLILDNNGNYSWSKKYTSVGEYMGIVEMFVNEQADIYLSGYFDGIIDFSTNNLTAPIMLSANNLEGFLVKYNLGNTNSINELNDDEFTLYPNPTNGKLTLKVNDQFNPQLVTIKNSNGQILEKLTVSKNTSNEFEIEINAENGIYFIAVFDGENTITKKVIKN